MTGRDPLPELRAALLRWAHEAGRDLPWRRTRDPWRVLVSELMLQQTQVPRVVPKYDAFVAAFPTVAACAAAPVGAVIELWAGLGYNRRAVNLHATARLVVERHGGELPEDLPALMALPGIGPYTARAVLAFAFEHDIGVVDTNVSRVVSRWHGRSMKPKELQASADALVPDGRGWAWNQAMFDLGAGICRPATPDCVRCPVASHCAWRGQGADPAVPPPRQSTFAGSDRQGRGRLVDALRRGSVAGVDLAAVMGWPQQPDRAASVAATVIDDGLAVWDQANDVWHLPS